VLGRQLRGRGRLARQERDRPQVGRADAVLRGWFRTTSTTGGRLLGFGNAQTGLSSSYERSLSLTNAGKVVFGVFTGLVVTVVSPAAYNDGAWHEAVATMDGTLGGGGMRLYVDGVPVAANANILSQPGIGYWRIGYDNLANWGAATPTTYGPTGAVDDAAVYATVLTPAKVSAHYAAGRF